METENEIGKLNPEYLCHYIHTIGLTVFTKRMIDILYSRNFLLIYIGTIHNKMI